MTSVQMTAYGMYQGCNGFVRGPADPPSVSPRCIAPEIRAHSRKALGVPRLHQRHSIRLRSSLSRVLPADSLVAAALSKRKLSTAFGSDLPFDKGVIKTVVQDDADMLDVDEQEEPAPVAPAAAGTSSSKPLKINLDLQLYRARQQRIAGESRQKLLSLACV